ncbi:MAG: prolipoprotein diacylglyceryl transferase [Azospirillaceae bacterium]
MLAIPFPAWLDPVALEVGPLVIRWYALAYIAGFVIGWRYCLRLTEYGPARPNREDFDDFLTWAIVGTILGGRLGYVLFYNFPYYIDRPLEALRVWEGGMAFHGGILGVTVAMLIFARRRDFSPFALADVVAAAAPIGLFLGRLANFVNGELWGRTTDLPWGVIFPTGGPEPRHPSQLYEAVLEGLVLFAVLFVLARRRSIRARPGQVAGAFLIGYGVARFLVEFVREPDPQLGLLVAGLSMGQLLSVPMIVLGLVLVAWARRRPAAA